MKQRRVRAEDKCGLCTRRAELKLLFVIFGRPIFHFFSSPSSLLVLSPVVLSAGLVDVAVASPAFGFFRFFSDCERSIIWTTRATQINNDDDDAQGLGGRRHGAAAAS